MFIECRHILPRGAKCKAAALKGHPYCYFHDKLHTYTQDGRREDKGTFCLPSIEDASGIQLALTQIMNAMANGRLDSREGVRLIYGLQVGIQALDRVSKTPPQEIVQATSCDGIGVDIAIDEAQPGEPHPECRTCVNRFGCDNIARQNKKSWRQQIDENRDRRERAEREPLALPASGTPDLPGPGDEEPHEVAFEEIPLCEEVLACADGSAPVLPPSPCPDWEADAYRPTTEFVDPQQDAERAARIDKFRPLTKGEAASIDREQELCRMLADHEITMKEFENLNAQDTVAVDAFIQSVAQRTALHRAHR
jgi:hypothetical protein